MFHDLLIGVDHADPYVWSAVLLAHVIIGLVLTGTVAALLDAYDRDDLIDGHGRFAAQIVVTAYVLIWEGAVQHFAEGLGGSLTDTLGIAAGAVIGLMAWARQGARMAVAVATVAAMLAWGLWGRK